MKAGLVTFSNAPNFGAFFQSVASNLELKRRGVVVENYDPNPSIHYTRQTWRPQSFVYKAQAKSYRLDRQLVGLDPKWIGGDESDNLSNVDAIFVGSDQVLNLNCLQDGRLDRTLLPAISHVPKFGLAMSAYSIDDLELARTDRLRGLSGFSRLSFREAEVAQWINDKIGIEGQVLPDPCFLLTADDMDDIASKGQSRPRNMSTLVAGYGLQHWASDLTRSVELPGKVKYINYQYRHVLQFGLFTSGPLQALRELLQAEVVVTNSFHFAVVAIITNKKVIVPFGHAYDGGGRLRNLGGLLEFAELGPNARVYDYAGVRNPAVEALRQSVLEYLDECVALVARQV